MKINLRSNSVLFFVFCISGMLLSSCSSPKAKARPYDLTVDDLASMVLGKKLSELSDFNGAYRIRDTILSSEDDDTEWKGEAYYENNTLLFIAEANWVDSIHVSRITIYSNMISTKTNIHIGCTFYEIKDYVSSKVPTVPDGYLSLDDKSNKKISYWFNIEKYPQLTYGVKSIWEIPKNLAIQYIVVMENP